VAALRAIGFSRRRVAADLLAESALLVVSGAVLSLPAGALLSLGLDAILRAMPGFPQRLHFFVFEARTVFLQLALLALVGFVATLYPILLAVRLPIAATLRKEVVS
jgi:ABC-type lipoprotein release transport system permease subunit